MESQPPICDYEGSDYRTRFWLNQGRSYEDQVERIALRRLIAPQGETLLDIGAGFGRYADEFRGYQRVVLLDYSASLLREAQALHGDDPRYIYVAANWYQMPFVDGLFDALVQIRTMHHAAEPQRLLQELARISRPSGRYVLEFANKRNLKAIARYLLRRQRWSPFTPEPVEFTELNYDFHPSWMQRQLRDAGFEPQQQLSVSHFRIWLLKRLLPTRLLVKLDSMLQPSGRWLQLSPSLFLLNRHPSTAAPAAADAFFACPVCRTPLQDDPLLLRCSGCGRGWPVENGLYNFKQSLN